MNAHTQKKTKTNKKSKLEGGSTFERLPSLNYTYYSYSSDAQVGSASSPIRGRPPGLQMPTQPFQLLPLPLPPFPSCILNNIKKIKKKKETTNKIIGNNKTKSKSI